MWYLLACAVDKGVDTSGGSETGLGSGGEVPEWPEVRELLAGYQASFVPMSDEPLPSVASQGSLVRAYASPEAAESYADLGRFEFPVGGAVVREVYSGEGALTGLTAVIRLEEGYSECGDLFFVKATPALELVEDEAGPVLGDVAACASCHLGQASRSYLFGPPA